MARQAGRWTLWLGACAFLVAGLTIQNNSSYGEDPKPPLDAKSRIFLLTGQEPAEPFVPLEPRTEEDTRRLEAVKQFCVGAYLENEYRWNDAIAAYRKALENDPRSLAIYKALINACNVARNTKDAAKFMREAVDLAPDDYELLGRLGESMEEQDQIEPAIELYKRALASPKLERHHPFAVLLKLKLGVIDEQLHKFDEASDYYTEVMDALDRPSEYKLDNLQVPPAFLKNRAETYERFGNTFRQAKRYDDALRAFRQAQAVSPLRAKFSQNIAQVYMDQEKYDQAMEYLEKYLKEQPQGSQAYEQLAEILTKLNRSSEVLPRVQAAAEKDRFNVGLQYFLGTLFEAAGDIEKAKEIYLAVLKNPPDSRIYKSLARIYQKEDRFRDLILLLGDGLEKQMDGRGGVVDAVDEQFNVLASDPDTAKRVVDTARQIIQEDPKRLKLGALYFVAKVAQVGKRYDVAVEFYRLCIAERPRATPLVRELAWTLEFAGQTDEAIKTAQQAIELDPDGIESQSTLAGILEHSGQYDKAIERYEQILKDFGDDADIARKVRYLLSNCYVQRGDTAKAEKALEEILQRHPDDSSANNDLGYLWADQGKNLEQSLEMVRKALGAEPENPAYLDSMGWVLYKLGRASEGRKYLEQAAASDYGKQDATIIDHLADVYLRLKETAKASDLWQKALKMLEDVPSPRRDEKRMKEIQEKLKALEDQKKGKSEIKGNRADSP